MQHRTGGDPNDRVLWGHDGYWEFWWAMMHEGTGEALPPIHIDVVVADDGWFLARDWVGEFDPGIVDYVVRNRLATGRVLVAPGALGTPSGDVVRFLRSLDVEVRIFSSRIHYSVYGEDAAVLREHGDAGEVGYRLTRCVSTIGALRSLFALQWSMGMPWHEAEKGAPDILHLLARGLTDEQVAKELSVSVRTVSRRVTELMRAAGARTRFELGVRFAQAELAVRGS